MLNEVWGALIIFFILPILGGLPLIAWFTYAVSHKQLTKLGTGNISVSAAFYHGGTVAGILAVISEAAKGIIAVLLARTFFPTNPTWEIIALIALVMGRYWISKGAGATNAVWGYAVHDWRIAGLSFLIGGISFTVLREREVGRIGVLVLFPILTMLLHAHDSGRIVAAICLAVVLGWIYKKLPDDLDLAPETGQSQATFRFFQGSKTIISLDTPLEVQKAGQKAATLSKLKRLGYPVPQGWVLPAGDDLEPIVNFLHPSTAEPLVVRSSAVGEDSETASAAGQYDTVLNVTSQAQLRRAISRVIDSYDNQAAVEYRRDRAMAEDSMAVLVQKQVLGVFSGVAFSRDPVARTGDWVVIEALPGDATKVVSGQVTPQQYRVYIAPDMARESSWVLPEENEITVEGTGDIPQQLIKQVAFLARHLENRDRSIPQDIEWSYDGETLWLLQSRPITTLLPIWTRKIASEVIPGLIRPLTWSINRPLTCGVWGEIFTIVLANRAARLDFNSTATLHYSRAYFNASLLGEIFRRMGLPEESLEFLTRGAKFSKPPILSTLQNVPGLMRLLGRELKLKKDFERDYRQHFSPALAQLERDLTTETPQKLLEEINLILELLKKATYYSILSPLSAALRQAVFKAQDGDIDNSQTPEVSAINAIASLATEARNLNIASFEDLAQTSKGQEILRQFEQLVIQYGYLSEVGTDIAVSTWREEPQLVRDLFMRMAAGENETQKRKVKRKKGLVQERVDLKGRVTEVYSRLLALLRWRFVALEKTWLLPAGDIFFLELEEVKRFRNKENIQKLIAKRRSQYTLDSNIDPVPALVYGQAPTTIIPSSAPITSRMQGIGASAGQVEGYVLVVRSLQSVGQITRETILVVPYTDSGWSPLLASAGGLIAEVGGRLSHGAIVAREYGIPAVMDVHNATTLFKDGQRVRIDGQLGIVELL